MIPKMFSIDEMLQSSIDPKTWNELLPIEKLKILKLAGKIQNIIHNKDRIL